jgi:hypothetical protein
MDVVTVSDPVNGVAENLDRRLRHVLVVISRARPTEIL